MRDWIRNCFIGNGLYVLLALPVWLRKDRPISFFSKNQEEVSPAANSPHGQPDSPEVPAAEPMCRLEQQGMRFVREMSYV